MVLIMLACRDLCPGGFTIEMRDVHMCDTMVALGNSTEDGSVLFAKNSDRQPNEPHIMIRIPRKRYSPESDTFLQATYIKIPQVKETYEVVLLKPSWIWGCEMGWNEFGLNIGNEAVFTKEEAGKPALTGMDMARLALERCRTSAEAVDLITGLLAAYGQGGNCGYEKPFTYHNSFLIADRETAWVLETAGQYWGAKQGRDIYCISNCLSIENDFDKCHPDAVKHAVEKGWCKSGKDFSFAKCYGNKLFTAFSGSMDRRGACEAALHKAKGKITAELLKSTLRTHHRELDGKLFKKKSLRSVCMHAGGMIGDQTTGSYVASLSGRLCTYWVTGASLPCIAVFKPLWLLREMPVFAEQEQDRAVSYWKLREKLHRLILAGGAVPDAYLEERARLEESIESRVRAAVINNVDDEQLSVIMMRAFEKEDEFINEQLKKLSNRTLRLKGGLYYRHYWKTKNSKLNI
jgi:secernin